MEKMRIFSLFKKRFQGRKTSPDFSNMNVQGTFTSANDLRNDLGLVNGPR